MKKTISAVLAVAISAFPLVPAYAQQPSPAAYPLAIDSGSSALWQSLQKLKTRASLMMVVAHPDDEDGGLLAYESRGQGADTTLLTLNRGEGGQNVMTDNYWDELGILRTEELLAAGNYYGVHQRFTRVADYGFSKTLEEAFKSWGHDRVLYDVVRQVRLTRPLVISSVFAGNVSDGHGHHQTAGVMAQEAYKLAGDPKVFPDQIAAGLKPWSPLKVYARVPFARVGEKGIFDYATGHWEPVRFKNYVTGEFINGVPSITLEVPEGNYNPIFGKSYLAVAREGLANQKSQNDGVGIPPARPFGSPYHLYASRATPSLPARENTMFDGIDISLAGIAEYAPAADRAPWRSQLQKLSAIVDAAAQKFDATDPAKCANDLAAGLENVRSLIDAVQKSSLSDDVKYNMYHELEIKEQQFNDALNQSLSLSVVATVNPINEIARMGPFGDMRGNTATYQVATPLQPVVVNIHVADQGSQVVHLEDAKVVANSGDWKFNGKLTLNDLTAGGATDFQLAGIVPADEPVTKPYFTRPTLEQSYYDINDPKYLGLPTMPYPLAAKVEYTFAGVKAHLAGTVQTVHRINTVGPVLEPLLIAPAISLTVSPGAGVVPMTGQSLSLSVNVHSSVKGPAEGDVKLKLPAGWTVSPPSSHFKTSRDGDEQNLNFIVTPAQISNRSYNITAVASYGGKEFSEGFTTIGWPGLRPYPYYRPSTYRATGVDVKVAPAIKVGYVMGTGDDVPSALDEIGIHVTRLTPQDIANGNLSTYDTIVIGIRAYTNRADLRAHNNRLLEYVKNGGTVVVQYQQADYRNFAPYNLSVPGDAEKVVEEDNKVTILKPSDPLLNWPNKITTADFDNWVEERGHGFAKEWAPEFTALTEMHDEGQDPQKGGLLYAKYGQGYYIYMSYAFFRELPEGVPGAFRIMANLISAGKRPGSQM